MPDDKLILLVEDNTMNQLVASKLLAKPKRSLVLCHRKLRPTCGVNGYVAR